MCIYIYMCVCKMQTHIHFLFAFWVLIFDWNHSCGFKRRNMISRHLFHWVAWRCISWHWACSIVTKRLLIPTASSYYAGLPEHHSEEVERFMIVEIRTRSCIQNSESIINYHIRKWNTQKEETNNNNNNNNNNHDDHDDDDDDNNNNNDNNNNDNNNNNNNSSISLWIIYLHHFCHLCRPGK